MCVYAICVIVCMVYHICIHVFTELSYFCLGNPLEDWPCMWQCGPVDPSVEAAMNEIIGRQLGCAVCAVYRGSHIKLAVTQDLVSQVQKEQKIASQGLRRSPRKRSGHEMTRNLMVCKDCYVAVHPGRYACTRHTIVLCCIQMLNLLQFAMV